MRNDDPKARLNALLGWSTLAWAMMLATAAETASAEAGDSASRSSQADEASPSSGMPDILVRGSRTHDVDIQRTRDDIQPYVVFDAEQIARSAAQNIEDFLQSNLPMNAQQTTASQLGPQTDPRGRIDLRGLGPNQTLILVDGRRLPSISTGDSFGQPNISGISMSQIERIEILPATASGIYGGGATGGVINIILKRKYSGIDIDATYGNTFHGDVGQYRIGMNGGFELEGGRTSVLFAASHSEADVLQSSDRDFFRRGAQLQLRNDPSHASVLFGGANICSTEDGVTCSAQPLALKGGGVLSSPFTSVPDRYAGPASDGGAALANNAGKLQFDRAGTPIWSAPDVTAYSFNLSREFSSHFEAYADFSHDRSRTVVAIPTQLPLLVAADSQENPFQQDVLTYGIPNGKKNAQSVENTRANVGAIVRLPHDWSSSLEYSWLRNTIDGATSLALGANPSAGDAVARAAFRDLGATPLTNPTSLFSFFDQNGGNGDTLQTVSLRTSGPVVKLPGGNLIATALLEGRNERSDSTVNAANIFGVDSFTWNPPAKRNVRSGYLELRAPIISEANDVRLVNALEVMASARRDAYKTQFSGSSINIDGPAGPFPPQVAANNDVSSTDFTLGFRYAPTSDITFRASFGTGFVPPNLTQIRGEPPSPLSPFVIFLLDLRDPARGDELIPGPLTALSGGNPGLKPEQSDSASFGAVFTPDFLHGLRVSVDYTNIRKRDEITTLPLAFFIANEPAFPGRVVRGPGDGSGMPGPITQIDASSLNLAKSELRALDIQADYKFSTSDFGSWRFYLIATETRELSRTVLPTDAAVDRVGFGDVDGPLRWRGNAGFDWSKGAVSAGWNAQYYGSYRVCSTLNSSFQCASRETSQGASRLSSQKYHDIYVRYAFPEKSGALANVDLRLAINNLFNERGPTIASGLSFINGPPSYVDPRLRRFTLVAHKHF